MNPIVSILIALGLVMANAFFVASEFSLLSLDRSQLDTLKSRRRARLIGNMLDKLTFHLSSAQFGITLAAVLLGYVIEPLLARLFEPLLEPIVGEGAVHGVAIGVSLAIATAVHLVLGEQIPKIYSIARPLPTASRLSPALKVYSTLVGPITSLLNRFSERAVGLFGMSSAGGLESVESVEDLEYYVKVSSEEGTLEPEDAELLTASLRFAAKTTADVFMPRTEVAAITATATAADLAELSVATGFSRFPVVESTTASTAESKEASTPARTTASTAESSPETQNLDALVGLVHVKSVFDVPREQRAEVSVGDLASELFAVPLGLSLRSLLAEMRRRRMQMAVVLDEHGGMAGVVTLENILEMLVGDIDDEHDETQEVSENLISGLARAEEVREVTGFAMPEGDYETIAGFLISEIKRIPNQGETVLIDGWTWEVAEMDARRIAWLRFEGPAEEAKPDKPEPDQPEPDQPKRETEQR